LLPALPSIKDLAGANIKTMDNKLLFGIIAFFIASLLFIYGINKNNIAAAEDKLDSSIYEKTKGKILLKIEDAGKAFYVNPRKNTIHYLGRPGDAFMVMRQQGVGIKNADLSKIPVGLNADPAKDKDNDGVADDLEKTMGLVPDRADSDRDGFPDGLEIERGYDPLGKGIKITDKKFSESQKGRILLQVESHGEAWYVNPANSKRYYLGRPSDAFNIMHNMGIGISNNDFNKLTKNLKAEEIIPSSGNNEDQIVVTYEKAQLADRPYHCEFKLGFAGGFSDGQADIIGKDFILKDHITWPPNENTIDYNIISARKNGWGYSWSDDKAEDRNGYKVDIGKYEAETTKILGRANYFEGLGPIMWTPPQDATCSPITSVSIDIPDRDYMDYTDQAISLFNNEVAKQWKAIDSLTFQILLPSYDGYKIVKSTQNISSNKENQKIPFNLTNSQELIFIDEESIENSPDKCQTGLCALVATTPSGYKIYSDTETWNGITMIKYFVRINETAINFHANEHISGKFERLTLTNERLISIVDSFKPVTKEAVKNIPEGTIYY
jgi:hypothetical protein